MPSHVDLDMIELIDNKLTVDEYLKLRALVGWKKLSREQAQKALDNSLLVVGAGGLYFSRTINNAFLN